MTIRNEPLFVVEAAAAAPYLFSAAVFPLPMLPAVLQPICFVLPLMYWLELIRRALLGPGFAAFPTLGAISNPQLFGILAAQTPAFGLLAACAFRCLVERVAREKGLVDTQGNP